MMLTPKEVAWDEWSETHISNASEDFMFAMKTAFNAGFNMGQVQIGQDQLYNPDENKAELICEMGHPIHPGTGVHVRASDSYKHLVNSNEKRSYE